MASLGAIRRGKTNGVVVGRVLLDGTHRISVNNRMRLRDPEGLPTAADLKRSMREKSKHGLKALAPPDVSAAKRRVPHRECGLACWCHVSTGSEVNVNTVGTSQVLSA